MLAAGLRAVEVVPVAGLVDVEVELVAGFSDTDLRRFVVPPALGLATPVATPVAAVEEAVAEGRNDEVEGFFAGTAPGVRVLPDPVGVFRALVELVAGVVFAGLRVVDGLGTAGLEVVTAVRTVEDGRPIALDAVELGLGARGAAAAGGLPIKLVVCFGLGATAAEVEDFEEEVVVAAGRGFAVDGFAREVAVFFGLARSLLDGIEGPGEAVGASTSTSGGASGCSVSGVGGTSCTSGILRSETNNWVPPVYFAVSSPFVGAGVEPGTSDPGSSWAVAEVVDLSLSARFQDGALALSEPKSFPVSCWAIARGLVAPSVPVESLRGSGAIVEPPGAPTMPAGLEVEVRFCDVVSNLPIRFATEGRGLSSGSGLFREG